MIDCHNNSQRFNFYLRNLYGLKDPNGHPFDEWINILSHLNIYKDNYPKSETYPNGAQKTVAYFTELAESNNEYVYKPNYPVPEYPFDNQQLENILSINELSIGNPELGEIIRINHIEPLRYLHNLEELSICNNTVTSLLPIWNHSNLKTIWIENTMIPISERSLFKNDHPHCRLEDQVYL